MRHTLDIFLLHVVALAENLDSASQTKFSEDFIRKMEEWEQKKKFGKRSSACRSTVLQSVNVTDIAPGSQAVTCTEH